MYNHDNTEQGYKEAFRVFSKDEEGAIPADEIKYFLLLYFCICYAGAIPADEIKWSISFFGICVFVMRVPFQRASEIFVSFLCLWHFWGVLWYGVNMICVIVKVSKDNYTIYCIGLYWCIYLELK